MSANRSLHTNRHGAKGSNSSAQLAGATKTTNTPSHSTITQIAQLQKSMGNRAVMQLLSTRFTKANSTAPTTLPAQMNRAQNPYAWGNNITSHHIIPHELLTKVIKHVPDPRKTMSEFLPAFDNLTLEQIYLQQSVAIKLVNTTTPIKKRDELPSAYAQQKFGALGASEKNSLIFIVNGTELNFDTFKQQYQDLAGGVNSVPGMDDMLDAFYEWQSGNQFYGPDRIEPGASNDFDADAKLIYGDQQTDDLQDIFKNLKGAGTNGATIATELNKLSTKTTGKDIPAYDPTLWYKVDTDQKVASLQYLFPTRTIAKGKSIHKELIDQKLRSFQKTIRKEVVHPLLSHLKKGQLGLMLAPETINGVSFQVTKKENSGKIQIVNNPITDASEEVRTPHTVTFETVKEIVQNLIDTLINKLGLS